MESSRARSAAASQVRLSLSIYIYMYIYIHAYMYIRFCATLSAIGGIYQYTYIHIHDISTYPLYACDVYINTYIMPVIYMYLYYVCVCMYIDYHFDNLPHT